MTLSRRSFARRAAIVALLGACFLVAGMRARVLQSAHAAISFPQLTYTVETTSGAVHKNTTTVIGLLTPIDVNNDLVPDVDVLVNVVDLNGITNPPDLTKIVRVTLTVTRDPTGLLTGTNPPLRIVNHFTLLDLTTFQPSAQVGVGYDSGPGGAMPPHFAVSLGGVQSLFNPLTATIDTVGGISGLNTNILNGNFPGYLGPLNILASVGSPGSPTTDITAAYKPFPGSVTVGYGSDSAGNHLHVSQAPGSQVHLAADVTSGPLAFHGDVDPLPNDMQADFATAGNSGNVTFTQHANGRRPDVGFRVSNTPAGQAPTFVKGAVTSLPDTIKATWNTAPNALAATFDASGQGLGGADVDVRNYAGNANIGPGFVPNEQQYVSYRTALGGPSGHLTQIAAHVERIRHVDLTTGGNTIIAHTDAGDGEKPLQVNYYSDSRSGTDGSLLDTTATVAPLPSQLGLQLDTGPTPTSPIHVIADSNQSSVLTDHLELAPAGATPGCGNDKTICADAVVRHLPGHLDLREGNLDALGTGINLDTTPVAGSIAPDVVADVTFGKAALDSPINAVAPLIGHVELDGIPRHVRARIHNGADQKLDRAEFHGCDWDFFATTPHCTTPAEAGAIARAIFSVRNFTEANRPASIAPIPTSQPQYLTLVSRQATVNGPTTLEAAGLIRQLAHAELRTEDGIVGLRTTVGQGLGLEAHVDTDDPTATQHIDATVPSLPGSLDLCMRKAATTVGTTTGAPFTANCEVANAFGETPQPARTPLTVWFSAPTQFSATASGFMTTKNRPANPDATDTFSLTNATIPMSLTANFRGAGECKNGADCLPLRATYVIPANSPPVGLTFSDAHTLDDAGCLDPRTAAVATCISGQLQNIPQSADVCFDPQNGGVCDTTDTSRNLVVKTVGASPTNAFNIHNLNLSTVSPDKDHPGKQSVLRLTDGEVLGIPALIKGTITDTNMQIQATPALGEIDGTIRNFVGPDEIGNLPVPAQRAGLGAPHSQVAVFGRGDFLKVLATVKQVSSVGFRTATTATGAKLKDQIVNVGFDPNQVVRLYADTVSRDDGGQTIADVTIVHNPATMQVCFRGPDAAAATAVNPVWCDNGAPNPGGQGAVELRQSGGSSTEVHAYVRQAKTGNRGVLASRIDITGLPSIVRGTFTGAGAPAAYDVAGLASDGTTPQGIGDIKFNAASFDLPAADSGYTGSPLPSFTPTAAPGAPFPPAILTSPFISAVATDNLFQAIGEIGNNGAHVQHVAFTSAPCPAPAGRDDYPGYQANVNKYTCVRVDTVKDGGVGATPLNLAAIIERGGKRISLDNAGLTDLPQWFQATIAQPPRGGLNADGTVLRRCGAVGGPHPETFAGGCAPPLIRFDSATPGGSPHLFGVVHALPKGLNVADIDNLAPAAGGPQLPDDANQLPKDWTDTGFRLKVLQKAHAGADDDTLVKASLNVAVPDALTIDQLQSFSDSTQLPATDQDLRAHFVARSYTGGAHVVDSLGNLELLFKPSTAGQQILAFNQRSPLTAIPGEVGIDVYGRHGEEGSTDPATPDAKSLFQIDLRLAKSMGLEAHLANFQGIGSMDATVRNLPAADLSSPDYVCNVTGTCAPGARIRAFVMSGPNEVSYPPHHLPDPSGCEGDPKDPVFSPDSANVITLANITMNIDFMQAKRLDAVVHTNAGGKVINGIDVAGFANVDPANTTPAKFYANGSLTLDPLNVQFTQEDFNITSVDLGLGTVCIDGDLFFHLDSNLIALFAAGSDAVTGGNITGTSHFTLQQNLLHMLVTSSDGPSIIDAQLRLPNHNSIHVTIDSITLAPGVTADVTYDPGPNGPDGRVVPMDISYVNVNPDACDDEDHQSVRAHPAGSSTATVINPGETADMIVNPINDSRVDASVHVIFSIDIQGKIYHGINDSMCEKDPRSDLINAGHPSDPLGYPGHPVPGTPRASVDNAPTPTQTPAPADGPDDPPEGPAPPDTKAPFADLISVPSAADGLAGFFTRDPLVAILAADDPGGAGIASIHYRIDGGADNVTVPAPLPVSTDIVRTAAFVLPGGTHTVTWFAVDRSNNTLATKSATLKVDDALPVAGLGAPAVNGAGGWYVSTPTFTLSAADPNVNLTAGSGVATLFASVDGAPYSAVANSSTLTVPAGVHVVRAYAVDGAGKQGRVVGQTVHVDLTHPVTTLRTSPATPLNNGWFRDAPLVSLGAVDGDQNAGVQAVRVSVDGAPFATYTTPFSLGSGVHTLAYQAMDNSGVANLEAVRTATIKVDLDPPTVAATGAAPNPFLPLLGPTRLQWRVGDSVSPTVHTQAFLYMLTGDAVRRIDGSTVPVAPNTQVNGFTAWDGQPVPPGLYFYSVLVNDEAGNFAQSGTPTAIVKVG